MTWTMTGSAYSRARVRANSRAVSSCPSTGPVYLMPRSSKQPALDGRQHALVARIGAQGVEVVGQPADGGGVGAAVVVDHDDQVLVGGVGDVVQRLPGHAPRQRPVADHRHHVAVGQALEAVGPGDAVRPGQGRRGVGVLHHVVHGLGPGRVAGHPAALAQAAEVLAPGEELVDVGLVAGVEDDGVARGAEDPVQGDGQLHHAQVGAQVTAGARDGGHQVAAYLRRERDQVLAGQAPQVGGAADGRQQGGRGQFGGLRPGAAGLPPGSAAGITAGRPAGIVAMLDQRRGPL